MLLSHSFDLPSSWIRLLLLFWVCSQNCERLILVSSCLSICLSVCLLSVLPSLHPFIVFMEHMGFHWMNSYEIWYLSTFQKSVKKIQVSLKADNYNWYFIPEDQYTFWIIQVSYSVLLRMRNVSDTNYRVYHNTHFMFNNFFFQNSCHLWDNVRNMVDPDSSQMTI
jgi:hypothetical protein